MKPNYYRPRMSSRRDHSPATRTWLKRSMRWLHGKVLSLLPIFDTCMVTGARKLSGRPISEGGCDHTSHRHVALGVSPRRAVGMLFSCAISLGALVLMLKSLEAEVVWLIAPGFTPMTLFLGLYLGKVRIYNEEQPQQASNTTTEVLADSPYKRRIFEVALDVVLIMLAYYGAYLLRWDADFPPEQLAIFASTLPCVIVIQMSVFLLSGVYQGLWRYTGIDDLILIIKSVLTGTLLTSIVILALYGFRGPSRAVLILYVLLLFVFVGGSRLSCRVLRELIVCYANGHANAIPVLIYGAGDGGELLMRELLNNSERHYVPVGFIDDDARKVGKLLHGYCIFGTHELPDLIRKHSVQEVLISSAKVPESKLDVVRHMGVDLKRMSLRIE